MKKVTIEFDENPRVSLEVLIYDPEGDYDIRYIHPVTKIEVERIGDLLQGLPGDEATLLKDWHDFINAIRLVTDRTLLSNDRIILLRDGTIKGI